MKKSKVIRYIWLFMAVVISLTLYFAYIGTIVEPLRELLIVIEGAVVAELILSKLSDVFNQPTISLYPHSHGRDFGFSVTVKDKNVQDATFCCNEQKIKWQERDGREIAVETLLVGNYYFVYPFRILLTNNRIEKEKQVFTLSIVDKQDDLDKQMSETSPAGHYLKDVVVPRGSFGFNDSRICLSIDFGCWIRIVGLGIEEELDRFVDFEFFFSLERKANSDSLDDIIIDTTRKTKKLIL